MTTVITPPLLHHRSRHTLLPLGRRFMVRPQLLTRLWALLQWLSGSPSNRSAPDAGMRHRCASGHVPPAFDPMGWPGQ